ncbi:hypothetical protein V8G54_002350 [Vigna mungo]|uniref:Serine protease EDA2 n=1 Tax=Vigna mungo TaxID=3915 RepID=A0AAQ3SCF6_VIGMU
MAMRQKHWVIATALTLLLFVSFPAFSYGLVPPRTLLNKLSEGKYLTNQEHWFDQTLDHFSPYDHRQFRQRYYEFLDYFRIPDGPIFLLIGGEGTSNGIANDYLAVLAKKFGAALVSLEHRYYGNSSPFSSLETENLKYLSSKQALSDLASFRQYYQNAISATRNLLIIDAYSAFILFTNPLGPTSLGCLVLRHTLSTTTLSSRLSKGKPQGLAEPDTRLDVSNSMQIVFNDAVHNLCLSTSLQVESLNAKLNRTKIENPWFIFGGSYSGALSAWFRLKFPHLTCGSLASSAVVLAVYNFTEFDQQIGESAGPECKAVLQEITQLVEQKLASSGSKVKATFDAEDLEIDGDFFYYLADAAATAFQYGNPDKVCEPIVKAKKAGEDLVDAYAKYVKEYYAGTFGVSVQSYDQKYHLDLCENVFGKGTFPDVDATNLYYGGTKIAGSKIIFTNGSQDPWRHASKQTSSPDSELPVTFVVLVISVGCPPTLFHVLTVATVLIIEDVLKFLSPLKVVRKTAPLLMQFTK